MKRHQVTDASISEAIRSWYAKIYEPILQVVRAKNILAAFPGRTPSDLYVWIMEHWELLKNTHGSNIQVTEAAANFGKNHRSSFLSRLLSVVAQMTGKRL